MKNQILALCLGVAALGAGPISFAPTAAYAQDEVSFEFFQESLSPHGDWIQVGDYGLCWQPTGVSADWAPYTDGYWSYTDAGWTWVSYEDFGGITYHYGRWVSVEDTGWCWVPDYDWGPAWVSWRNDEEHVGWAPLPPEATWDASVGIGVTVDNSYDIGPEYYNFCDVEDFGAPVIREVLIPRRRNSVIIVNTVNITNISFNSGYNDGYYGGGIPFCGGPRYDYISSRVYRPIPALKLVRETNITNIYNNTVVNNTTIINRNGSGGRGGGRSIQAVQRGNQLIVPAPRVRRMDNPIDQLNIKPKRVIAKNDVRVNKGWRQAENAEQRQEIREKMNRKTADLPRGERAKAKPVEAADLAVVPVKGDPNAPAPGANGRNRRERAEKQRQTGDSPEEAVAARPEGGRGGRKQTNDAAVAGEAPLAAPGETAPGAVADGDAKKQRAKDRNVAEAPSKQAEEAASQRETKDAVAARREKAKGAADAARTEAMEQKDARSRAETRKALKEQQQAEQTRKDERQASEAAERRENRMERLETEKESKSATREERKKAQADDTDRSAARERAQAQAARERSQEQSNVAERAERQRESAAAATRAQRQQQAAQSEAGEQRRQAALMQRQQGAREQQQAERSQAARQQQQAERSQAARQQQQMQQRAVQAQRQQQADRSQQMQRQQQARQQSRPQIQQPQRQQGGGGGGGGEKRRNMSEEERAERKGR